MKKKILALTSVILIILVVILVILFAVNKESRELEVTTIINAKENYRCEVFIEDESIVKYIGNYSLNEKEHFNDGKSHVNFVFKGLKVGKTTICIKCINTVDDTILNEDTFNVMVNRRLETSIYVLEK